MPTDAQLAARTAAWAHALRTPVHTLIALATTAPIGAVLHLAFALLTHRVPA